MKLNDLPGDPGNKQKRKRRGRGESSGLGKTSGRGNKGLQARSGGSAHPGFEGGQMRLIRRIPKRGFTSPFRKVYDTVRVGQLCANFEAGTEVTVDALKQKGLVRSSAALVKILSDGEADRPLTVKVHAFSKAAREKLTAKGGRCEVI
ncbi:MAG: 50S ribosomal protein L15 [bacterium]